jgi:hypothetical protein
MYLGMKYLLHIEIEAFFIVAVTMPKPETNELVFKQCGCGNAHF